ncbi:Fpg/Nei family DNA glycosylase [Nocardioides daejeonensis]|uniref:Fpg/Nei family DNA glycosylase n=1 Tax=Nocardioides daejeonensis TaxID=1046556 RepID=UPI000D7497E2|nr:zinc finger domain-containing protein [Nocardioides daejeonensis]
MPEGHTLRRLAGELDDAFAGSVVLASSPQGRFAADAAQVDRTELVDADSWGKHLFIEFAGERFIHVHLGLIGRFDVVTGPLVPPVGEVRLRLTRADGAAHADLRGATRCDLIGAERRADVLAKLGPDPLRADADPDLVWQRIGRSERTIGDLLMDQSVLAGVGNVYRAEVLFRHRIHPLRPGRTLRRSQFDAIWADLVALMTEGVRTGRIDTVRPEHTPEAMGRPPRKDDHGGEVYVYRRTGQPCLVCGTPVRTESLVGRNSFWCPRCQPVFRSRARRD